MHYNYTILCVVLQSIYLFPAGFFFHPQKNRLSTRADSLFRCFRKFYAASADGVLVVPPPDDGVLGVLGVVVPPPESVVPPEVPPELEPESSESSVVPLLELEDDLRLEDELL